MSTATRLSSPHAYGASAHTDLCPKSRTHPHGVVNILSTGHQRCGGVGLRSARAQGAARERGRAGEHGGKNGAANALVREARGGPRGDAHLHRARQRRRISVDRASFRTSAPRRRHDAGCCLTQRRARAGGGGVARHSQRAVCGTGQSAEGAGLGPAGPAPPEGAAYGCLTHIARRAGCCGGCATGDARRGGLRRA